MKALYWVALILIKIISLIFFSIMFVIFCISFLCVKISEALNGLDRIALCICSSIADFLMARDKSLRTKVGWRK